MPRKKHRVTVVCEVCGKVEEKPPSDAKRYKTCSLECRGKYSSRRYEKKISKICEVCGKEFKVKPSHKDNRRTCSTECKYKLLEEHLKTLSGKGLDSVNWKGGRYITPTGYAMVYAPGNPMANSRGYVREHRLVMSEKIGRVLRKDEEVHHIDGNKLNNSPENLQLMTKAEHTALHVKERKFKRDSLGRIIGLLNKEE